MAKIKIKQVKKNVQEIWGKYQLLVVKQPDWNFNHKDVINEQQ